MSYLEFVRLVRGMRAAQKTYFQSRSATALTESKAIERDVDRAIENYYAARRSLFPELEPHS